MTAPRRSPLTNEKIFLTGGTGFLGQAVLERLLSTHPGTHIYLLIRGKGNNTGAARLETLMRKPVFKNWIAAVGKDEAAKQVKERITVIEGSLSAVELPADIDIVIHSASTVSFDPPIDEAFNTNVGGAKTIYGALLKAGADPHVVHVSTAYVGGIRKGINPESSLTHNVDWRAETDAANTARERVEFESRQPESLRRFLNEAKATHGKSGPQNTAAEAEIARAAWVNDRLVDYGRMRAESLGWTDVYTLTKSFAERAAEELWAQAGHRLSFVRPSIIESALEHPFPGWIDGYKVADPLIIAYGRGLLPDFPGLPDSVLDIIPVDFVVNAILAAAASKPKPAEPRYYHVSSGASNPLPFHEMYSLVNEYFTKNPIPKDGKDIEAPLWRFPGGAKVEKALVRREKQVAAASKALAKLPMTPRTRGWLDTVKKGQHDLGTLRAFTDLYRAYVQTEIIFDDARAKELHASLPKKDQATQGFDVTKIDWHDYFLNTHFPAVTALTRAYAARPKAKQKSESSGPLPVGDNIVAVFDLEGTVLDSNLIEQYLLLWAGSVPRKKWPHDLANFAFSLPKYYRAEKRDRGDFIRTFMRRYQGFKVAEIQRLAGNSFKRAMLRRALPDALKQVQAHRDAGHRTILVTGTIDLMVAPLAPFFDEVIAGRMHERDGVLTGYLADPPLVDEARAAWLRNYAVVNDIDLKHSYGYGDSHADISWLQLLGNANAVNPDVQLYRHAQDKYWNVLDWKKRATTDSAPNQPQTQETTVEGAGTSAAS